MLGPMCLMVLHQTFVVHQTDYHDDVRERPWACGVLEAHGAQRRSLDYGPAAQLCSLYSLA